MFIVLSVILSLISISLRTFADTIELGYKLSKRVANDKYSKRDKGRGVVDIGATTSISFIRVISFLVTVIRNMILCVGSFISLFSIGIVIVSIISAGSVLALFYDNDVDGSLYQTNVGVSSQLNKVESTSSKPLGITSESWNKADDVGKRIVQVAVNSILNPPNGKYLLYMQGNTGVGYADCSVYVCAVLEEALNKTFSGVDAPDGYDFSINKKSDLKGYVTTWGMQRIVRGNLLSRIGSTSSSLHLAQPGDILLNDGHVGFYVGVNEDGKHVMVHASTDTNPNCSGDIALSDGKKLEVGFSQVWGTYDIIRPSILLGK